MIHDTQGASILAIHLPFSPSFVYDTVTTLNDLKDEMLLLALRLGLYTALCPEARVILFSVIRC